VPYERVNPSEATAIFIRDALAAEDSALAQDPALRVLAENRAVVQQARRLLDRLRNPALTVDQDVLEGFYRERLVGPRAASLASTPIAAGASGAASATSAAGTASASGAAISGVMVPGSAPCIASSDALRRHLAAQGPARLRLALAELIPEDALARADGDFPRR
jgi:hypothetical protein